jgi:hypothetical protein
MIENATYSADWAADPKSPARARVARRAGDRRARPGCGGWAGARSSRAPAARPHRPRAGDPPPRGCRHPAPGKRARSPSAPHRHDQPDAIGRAGQRSLHHGLRRPLMLLNGPGAAAKPQPASRKRWLKLKGCGPVQTGFADTCSACGATSTSICGRRQSPPVGKFSRATCPARNGPAPRRARPSSTSSSRIASA